MKFTLLALFLTIVAPGYTQTSYSGFIDLYPIEISLKAFPNGEVEGILSYLRDHNSIVLTGQYNDSTLVLLEKRTKTQAKLVFKNFQPDSRELTGEWITFDGIRYPIKLKRQRNGELLQAVSLENHFFKLELSEAEQGAHPRVIGVNISDKKTGKQLQHFPLECDLIGFHNVAIGDYNFDGSPDFSVFESGYAGPNTSRIYFLWDPTLNQFITCDFHGTSLEFDNSTKLVYEHNQCCAGKSHINSVYKIVENKMVLVSMKCLTYNEATETLEETQCN